MLKVKARMLLRKARLFWLGFDLYTKEWRRRRVMMGLISLPFSAPFTIPELLIGIASYLYFAMSVGARSEGFLSYIITGMMLNQLLTSSLNTCPSTVSNILQTLSAYGGRGVSMYDEYRSRGISFGAIILARFIFLDLYDAFIRTMLFFIVGSLVFGLIFDPSANYMGMLIIMALGVAATSGIGFISGALQAYLPRHYEVGMTTEPLRWAVTLLVGLTSGVYFPPELLPEWLRGVAYLLPQTYAILGARRTLLEGLSFNKLNQYIYPLGLLAITLVPLGILLLRRAIEIAEKIR